TATGASGTSQAGPATGPASRRARASSTATSWPGATRRASAHAIDIRHRPAADGPRHGRPAAYRRRGRPAGWGRVGRLGRTDGVAAGPVALVPVHGAAGGGGGGAARDGSGALAVPAGGRGDSRGCAARRARAGRGGRLRRPGRGRRLRLARSGRGSGGTR